MALCHMDARSFVGIPCHHSLRRCEFRCTTVQSGTISRSHMPIESSIRCSRASLLACSALRRFSSAVAMVTLYCAYTQVMCKGREGIEYRLS